MDEGGEGGLGLSDADKINFIQRHELIKETNRLRETQVEQLELQAKRERTSRLVLLCVGLLLMVMFLWWLGRWLKVQQRYRLMIDFIDQARELGYFSLTSGSRMAWCAEYPNFTGVLFSKIINRNYPKAVALAFYSPPYSEVFSLFTIDEASYYLQKMLEVSEFNGGYSAQQIICTAWGEQEGIEDCLEECPIPYQPTNTDVAVESVQGMAMGMFLTSSLLFFLSGGTYAVVLAAGAAVGLGIGVGRSVSGKNQAEQQCQDLANLNCRIDVETQC